MGAFHPPGPWDFQAPCVGSFDGDATLMLTPDSPLPLLKGLLTGGALSGLLWSAALLPLLL